MALDLNQQNNPSPQGDGNPTDMGKAKASTKVAPDQEQLDREEEVAEKFLDADGNPSPDALRGSSPNRNYDKPDLNKPSYS
ncbi:MAG: hypothetical protein WBA12_15050 [Catalinimonas sp.]